MATIEQRLQVLESRNSINDNNVTQIMLVSFAGKDDPDRPINHIYSSFGDHYYMANNESEEDFRSRASDDLRKTRQPNPNSVLLLFGDRTTKDN